jgi:DNA-binding NarL/FixJ family response regulator
MHSSNSNINIAIVDDKAIVRKAIRDKLYSCSDIRIVLEAGNGEIFLNEVKGMNVDDHPDVVLMDLEMPQMDGIQTIAAAISQYPQMKFIVLTVYDNNEKLFEAIKAGASGYLLKDDNAINLVDAIRQVKDHNGVPMSPAIARKTLALLKNVPPQDNKNKDLDILSIREQDVLQHLVDGLAYKEIAAKLFISPATVRTHIANIYQKLHVRSKAQAIKFVLKNKK